MLDKSFPRHSHQIQPTTNYLIHLKKVVPQEVRIVLSLALFLLLESQAYYQESQNTTDESYARVHLINELEMFFHIIYHPNRFSSVDAN